MRNGTDYLAQSHNFKTVKPWNNTHVSMTSSKATPRLGSLLSNLTVVLVKAHWTRDNTEIWRLSNYLYDVIREVTWLESKSNRKLRPFIIRSRDLWITRRHMTFGSCDVTWPLDHATSRDLWITRRHVTPVNHSFGWDTFCCYKLVNLTTATNSVPAEGTWWPVAIIASFVIDKRRLKQVLSYKVRT